MVGKESLYRPIVVLEDYLRTAESETVSSNPSTSEFEVQGNSKLVSLWRGLVQLLKSRSKIPLPILHPLSIMKLSRRISSSIREDISTATNPLFDADLRYVMPRWKNFSLSELQIASNCFSHGNLKGKFSISVEIKPKCGFLPDSRFISEENSIKKRITRFKMHQSLKLHQREISDTSEYDPLDMLSGSKERVHKAITALFCTPQNNFRVFLNGSLIFGGLGGGADITSCMIGNAFEDVLKCVIQADDGLRTTNFLQLVTEAVSRSGLLDRLLEVQKLDIFDIEGAIHAYYDVVSQPCIACRDLGEDKLSGRYAYLHSMPLDKSLKIVRDYLIAATAKDLSMMISFRPREDGDVESSYSGVFLESTNQSFDYKASFFDLDMKPLKKMEHYYELDQQIVSCYTQMVKRKNKVENAATIDAYARDPTVVNTIKLQRFIHRFLLCGWTPLLASPWLRTKVSLVSRKGALANLFLEISISP